MIKIRAAQEKILTQNFLKQKILRFLKLQLPEKCNRADTDMLESISKYIKLAYEYDIKSERSLAKWSFLFLLTDERLLNVHGIKEYLIQPTPSQNEKVDRLMKSLAVGVNLTNTKD